MLVEWQLKTIEHCARDLEILFADIFFNEYGTKLQGGANEPLYLPAKIEMDTKELDDKANECKAYSQLMYRENFYASALHEIAHWCIAGENRRKLLDFGYWYEDEGRNTTQQKKFYHVEKKPQALEYLFSLAAGYSFRVSVDNIGHENGSEDFFKQVQKQAKAYCYNDIPVRAQKFCFALVSFYRPKINHVNWFSSVTLLLDE